MTTLRIALVAHDAKKPKQLSYCPKCSAATPQLLLLSRGAQRPMAQWQESIDPDSLRRVIESDGR